MASKSDLTIDSVDTESGGCQRDDELKHQHPLVYVVNSNYNPEEDSEDNFDEADLPIYITADDSKDDTLSEHIDSHLAAKKFEYQYKHQHQNYKPYRPPSIPLASRSPIPLFTMEENEDGTDIEAQSEVCSIPSANTRDQTPIPPASTPEFFVNHLPKGSEFLQQDQLIPEPYNDKVSGVQKRRASFGNNKTLSTNNNNAKRRSSVVTIAPGFHAGTEDDEPRERASSSAFGSKRLRYKRGSSFALTPQRSLRRYLTRDVLPHMDNYRHRMSFVKGKRKRERPTIDELMEKRDSFDSRMKRQQSCVNVENGDGDGDKASGKLIKFGWIEGVYMRCLLNIWGVMLFLRLTWVVGEAGLVEALGIITLANIVTTITAISMSAVSTNGQIKGGGIYYMISRALGPEFGGAIGVMFTLANSIAVAVYLIGFCDSLLDMLEQYLTGYNGIVAIPSERVNDVRLIGSISLVLILGLAIVGMDWVTRVQIGLLFLLLCSQVDFIIGSFLPTNDEEQAKGFVGYNYSVLQENLWSDYREKEGTTQKNNFFSLFAVFFPAVTGIVAGANLSGDLKDPGMAIPRGTLAAIATTYVSYIVYAVVVAATTLRDASGIVEELTFGTEAFNETAGDILNISRSYNDCMDRKCDYGSANSYQMMEVISAWGPLIYMGCFAATLSSAIASLVGAPRVLQAVAKDKLFPYIQGFGEGWGANNDPFRGYILVFLLALVCVLIGDLNVVSSLLSNFFVAAYALINFSVFHASILNSPGWRPSFKYYNKWVSLFGTILCIVVMFLMDVYTALGTFVCIILLYLYMIIRKPEVNWGSSTQTQSFVSALKAVQTLAKVEDHVKNYRPKLIVLSGDPSHRPCLVDFANLLTKRLSLLQFAQIIHEDLDWKHGQELKHHAQDWLNDNHIKAFYALTRNPSFSQGAKVAIELSGLGKLSPNMMLIGFHEHWASNLMDAEEYFKTLQIGFEMHLSVGVLRINGGLDISEMAAFSTDDQSKEDDEAHDNPASNARPNRLNVNDRSESKTSVDSGLCDTRDATATPVPMSSNSSAESPNMSASKSVHLNHGSHSHNTMIDKIMRKSHLKSSSEDMHIIVNCNGIPIDDEELVSRMTQFRSKEQKKGTIDVYWLYDDGGLTCLLPHILTTRSKFQRCKLRIFFLSNKKKEELEEEALSMQQLLEKFRIEFQDVIPLNDVTKTPTKLTKEEFNDLITIPIHDGHKISTSSQESSTGTLESGGASEASNESITTVISQTELRKHSDKTNFHLRIGEIVRQNSSQADLIVMTLPLPKTDVVPFPLYLAWLDFISRNMPPFLFVRGNQESVLTFYS